jgi:tetratricopeptide (TPR) repeat protein
MKRVLLLSLLPLVLLLAAFQAPSPQEPPNGEALKALLAQAELYYRTNNLDKAIEVYRKVVVLDPTCILALNNLGSIYGSIGRYENAVVLLRQAIQLDPGQAGQFTNLGNAYYKLRRHPEAIDAYKQALQLQPGTALTYYDLGTLCIETGRLDEAIEALKEAVHLDPNFANAHTNLGASYKMAGRYEEAVEALKEAVRSNPAHPGAYFILGDTYYRLGRYEEAAVALEKHAQVGRVDEPVYRLRGFSYLYLHRGEEAASDARACLKIVGWRSYSSQYIALLGYFGHRLARQAEEARQILQEATQLADTSAWPFPVIRYLKREIKLEQLMALAKNNDERTEAHGYAGLDLLLSGSKEEALEHFRWVEEYGNRDFVEYKLAEEELSRADNQSIPARP